MPTGEGVIRTFETGATRDTDTNKPDYEGFLSPLALEEFGLYMSQHRIQSDGSVRDSDNWQKGIPLDAYMKSLLRHVLDLWKMHRGYPVYDATDNRRLHPEEACCAIWFNVQGYLHEVIK